jgi:hypothetical protein
VPLKLWTKVLPCRLRYAPPHGCTAALNGPTTHHTAPHGTVPPRTELYHPHLDVVYVTVAVRLLPQLLHDGVDVSHLAGVEGEQSLLQGLSMTGGGTGVQSFPLQECRPDVVVHRSVRQQGAVCVNGGLLVV